MTVVPGEDTSLARASGRFPKTIWADILKARSGSPTKVRRHLDRLIRMYWTPVYTFIRAGWNHSPEDAKDLTQSFFADLLERDFLRDVSPDRGTFRSYLKACLKHFLLTARRDASRRKRGGDSTIVGLAPGPTEPAFLGRSPEEEFDQEWRACILREALGRVRTLLVRNGKEDYYAVLQAHDLAPGPDATYKSVSSDLKISLVQVRKYLAYARRLVRAQVESTIREYASTDEDVKSEMGAFLL